MPLSAREGVLAALQTLSPPDAGSVERVLEPVPRLWKEPIMSYAYAYAAPYESACCLESRLQNEVHVHMLLELKDSQDVALSGYVTFRLES